MSLLKWGFFAGAIGGVALGIKVSIDTYDPNATADEWDAKVTHHLLEVLYAIAKTGAHTALLSLVGGAIAKCFETLGTQEGPSLEELREVVTHSQPRPGR